MLSGHPHTLKIGYALVSYELDAIVACLHCCFSPDSVSNFSIKWWFEPGPMLAMITLYSLYLYCVD